jgi:hypothetical protein
MSSKLSKISILATTCFIALSGLNQLQAGFSIEINSAPPPPPHVIERRWDPPTPGAVWVEPHHEWIHGDWVWIHGYYMFPPRPGYVWVPAHYEFHHHAHMWIEGHWDGPPEQIVVVQSAPPAVVQAAPPPQAAAPAPADAQSAPPYGSRIGNTTQIQSPYSQFVVTSTAARDTVVYDANTGQPFRVP